MIRVRLSILGLPRLVALLALAQFSFATGLAVAAEAAPLKICLLSAAAEYESDKSLGEFQSHLESHYRIICERSFGKDKGEGLPNLEALDSADLMIVFMRRVTLPAGQLVRVQRYLASGRPVIGIRTASHAFQNYPEFDGDILGGSYKGHYNNDPVAVRLSAGRALHPVLARVTNLTSRKLYKNPALADDVVVLLEGTTAMDREPVAWVRERKGARVFYTSLGTREDFAQDDFRHLLVNAIFWTTRRDETGLRHSTSTPKPAASANP